MTTEKDIEGQTPPPTDEEALKERGAATDGDTPVPTAVPLTIEPNDPASLGRECHLPSFFMCPITKQVLQNPVVLSDGKSYEQSAVQEQNEPIMYPNRALKSIMADINISTATIISKHSLLKQAFRFFSAEEDRPLPDGFYCPITLSLIHKPVIDPQGYTYEKVAIYKWIEVNGDSPVTRAPLSVDQLVPNHSLEGLLEAEANRDDIEDIHPAIIKWKKESAVMVEELSMLNLAAAANANIATGIASDAARAATAILPFPTTPEELAAQLEEARRRRIRKQLCRFATIFFLVLIIVVGFFVPLLAAIAMVIMIFAMWLVMSNSTRSAGF